MLSGVAHSMGIGAVADFSLAEARERAAKYRKLAKQGIDPIEARRAERTGSSARAITFAACAEAYIANHKAAWKGARHAKQWTSSLEAYAYPALGSLPVTRIGRVSPEADTSVSVGRFRTEGGFARISPAALRAWKDFFLTIAGR
jgi:hypothetical protein